MNKREKPNTSPNLECSEVYEEIGKTYRYFLAWRERLFAGFLATLASLGIGFGWVLTNYPSYPWIITLVGGFISFVFFTLEWRIMGLYQACQTSGIACEEGLQDEMRVYTKIQASRISLFSHSWVLRILYFSSGCILLFLSLLSICDFISSR